ncbi:MAG: pantoate--beta-alanine ligase [Gammaproteobacteria bacterium]|nr:MAG: pantoate--beta-alanine ligase [Gammaproteobacteria bacterium]
MRTLASVEDVRKAISDWRLAGEWIAFVPTMGDLHQGHLELVRHALTRAPHVVASIFVNPTQFGPGEDFDAYPRTLESDQDKLEKEGVELLFAPSVETLYPGGAEETTRVDVPQVSRGLCDDFRPGHFAGVATVVARLFNLVQPDIAVFGEKDYQQLAVIRRMVRDLCWPIEIDGVPTVREADGLAMSSRNRYLSADERQLAPVLYQTLCEVAEQARARQQPCRALERQAMKKLEQAGFSPEYVSIRHAETLQPVETGDMPARVLAAARLGKARLIDNVSL